MTPVSYLFESIDLPKDLISVVKAIYNKKGIKYNIKKIHKDGLIWITSNNDKQFIRKKELYCVYDYDNGDTAWFSFVDNKIYDFNHEIGMFNIFHKDQKDVWKEKLYKEWLKDLKDKKHMYAWRD
jgi:hypothetical protein